MIATVNAISAVHQTIAQAGPLMGKRLIAAVRETSPGLTDDQIDIAIGELTGSCRITWVDGGWVPRRDDHG